MNFNEYIYEEMTTNKKIIYATIDSVIDDAIDNNSHDAALQWVLMKSEESAFIKSHLHAINSVIDNIPISLFDEDINEYLFILTAEEEADIINEIADLIGQVDNPRTVSKTASQLAVKKRRAIANTKILIAKIGRAEYLRRKKEAAKKRYITKGVISSKAKKYRASSQGKLFSRLHKQINKEQI